MEKVKTKNKTVVTIDTLKEKYKSIPKLSYKQECELMSTLVYQINFYPVNKEMVRKYGWMFAGLLAMYIEMSMYSMEKYPQHKGWFYCTKKDLYNKGHISGQFVAYTKNLLVKEGILDMEVKGLPAKEWFKINPIKLIELFTSAGSEKIEKINERTSSVVRQVFEQDLAKINKKNVTSVYPNIDTSIKPNIDTSIKPISEDINKTRYKRISKDILPISSNEDIRTISLSDTHVSASVLSENEKDIISYWNTLPNVTKHNLDPKSKTIQSACKMLSALLQGIPIISMKNNQPRKELREFFQTFKIDQVYLRKQWTTEEIKNLLLTAVTSRNKSKESGKVSLPNLLWNEFASRDKDGTKTAFSWFYYSLALDNTPPAFVEMARELAESLKTKNPPILKWANSLYRFSMSEEVPPANLSTLLSWHIHNKTMDYMPVVRDMEEFVKKYRMIEDFRSRIRKHNGKNKLHVDEKIVFYDALGNVIQSE
jgi:hypothetical protein